MTGISTAIDDENDSAAKTSDGDTVQDGGIAEKQDDGAEGSVATSDAIRTSRGTRFSVTTIATLTAAGCLAASLALASWFGMDARRMDTQRSERELYLHTARQGALNLTTIKYGEVDTDIQRIIDSATGTFYDDFNSRAAAFAEVVRQARSTSLGTITEAGIESVQPDGAQVLVATTVQTTQADQPPQPARHWRMRIAVHKVDAHIAKITNVEFVP